MKKLIIAGGFCLLFAANSSFSQQVQQADSVVQLTQTAPKSMQAGTGTLDSQLQQKQQQYPTVQQLDQRLQADGLNQPANTLVTPAQAEQGVVLINDDEGLPWLKKKEAPKNPNNLIRLNFDEEQESISADDRTALLSVVNRMQKDFSSKAVLKSFAKPRGANATAARQVALRRVLELRKFFEEHGIDFKRFTVLVMADKENSSEVDFVDIDKL